MPAVKRNESAVYGGVLGKNQKKPAVLAEIKHHHRHRAFLDDDFAGSAVKPPTKITISGLVDTSDITVATCNIFVSF